MAPYQWQPSQDPELVDLAPGSYTLRAVATDNLGLSAETSIAITVGRPENEEDEEDED